MIFAFLEIVCGLTSSLTIKIHKKLRNKALTYFGLYYAFSIILSGLVVLLNLPFALVFAIVIFLIFNWLKAKLPNEINDFKSNIVKYILFGLLGLFVVPILSLILLFVPFMARVALTLLALYIAVLIIASAITVITLSKIFANNFKDTIKTNDILRTIICICIITIAYRLLKLVPVVGFITNFTAIVTGIGISIKSILPKDKDKIE